MLGVPTKYSIYYYIYHVARWLRGFGNVHWSQIWDLPKIPPCGLCGTESCTCRNIHRLPQRKNGSFWTTTHPCIDWTKQPWLTVSLGEGQPWFETNKGQVCWIKSIWTLLAVLCFISPHTDKLSSSNSLQNVVVVVLGVGVNKIPRLLSSRS